MARLNPEPVIIRGDMQILYKTVADLMRLVFDISGEVRMPQMKFTVLNATEGDVQAMSRFGNPEASAQKVAIFDSPVEYASIPADASPELLRWWTIHTTMTRHAATVKVQKTERSLGMLFEFFR